MRPNVLEPAVRLRAIVSRYSVTITQIAKDVGVSRAHLSRVIAGVHRPHGLTRQALISWLDNNHKLYPIGEGSKNGERNT